MTAMLAAGGRIATERTLGWNRQLRITPLAVSAYFRTKLAAAYLTAVLTIVLLYLAGISLGVRLPASNWIEMTALILVALVPFAALGVLFGHLFTADSVGAAIGATTGILAFLGGSWFPIDGSGIFHDIAQCFPSYWLVQASRVSIGGHTWGWQGWLVVGVWTAVLTVLAGRAYRRDTKRA
jgi:ABC-2 type transport system permease protein